MDRYIKNFKNLFAAHPKGPKPVPKNVKPQPFHLNRFKESEIKEHLTYFEEICDFDLEPAGSNNSNINFRTPLGMLFLVQKVTNFKDPKSTLNGYSGTVYIVINLYLVLSKIVKKLCPSITLVKMKTPSSEKSPITS